MNEDYYAILNISNRATKAEVIKAFRELAKKYHPDKNSSSNASEKFREVFEAYEILKNDSKRELYDHFWNEHYLNKKSVSFNEYEPKFEERKQKAHQQAESYSKMPYEDFINSALFNIKFVVKKTPTIGAIILLFIFGIMFLIMLGFIAMSDIEGGMGAIMGLFILGLSIAFFAVGISDWNKLMAERKRQRRKKNYR